MIFVGMVLLSALAVSAWLVLRPANPVIEPETSATPPGLPGQYASHEELGLEPLPTISPEMATAIRQLSNHSTDGLKETVNPDGSVTLHHEDRLQSVMVGVVGSDGNIIIRHGEDFLHHVRAE